jgi:uncharacterized linocin/CFP29 family protein
MAKLFKLSVVADAAITSYVKGREGQAKRDGKLMDILQAEGLVSSMLIAPKEGEDRTLFDGIKAAIVMGFTAGKQNLLTIKAKTAAQKKAKRTAQQDIGAYVGNLKRDLANRESIAARAAAEEAGEEVDKEAKSTFESRLKRDLTKYIVQIQGLKGAQFTVDEMLKHLRSASALIK